MITEVVGFLYVSALQGHVKTGFSRDQQQGPEGEPVMNHSSRVRTTVERASITRAWREDYWR